MLTLYKCFDRKAPGQSGILDFAENIDEFAVRITAMVYKATNVPKISVGA